MGGYRIMSVLQIILGKTNCSIFIRLIKGDEN